MDSRTIGLLGGGQLGRMLCQAAIPLGIKIVVLDRGNSPAKKVNAENPHIDGSFVDADKIRQLAEQCDILTVEIEHVDTFVLEEIAEKGVEVYVNGKRERKRVEVQPSWRTLRTIQDKFDQKTHLALNGVATAESMEVKPTTQSIAEVGSRYGYPYMLKARKDAYDGRGNFPVRRPSDIAEALETLKGRELYAERWANFKMELAVMVVKTSDDCGNIESTIAYPAVETIHEDSVCKLVYAPARGLSESLLEKAQTLARQAVSSLWGKGVFGVELFLLSDDSLVVNEIAPRPHNSGHYTIEACPDQSQYKSQLFSILGLMQPTTTIPLEVPAAIMLNILGGARPDSHDALVKETASLRKTFLHLYGKESKPGRKIGHVTVTGCSMAEAEGRVSKLITMVNKIRMDRMPKATPSPPILPAKPTPLVAVTMGSDSDLPVLKPGIALLKDLGIPYYETITSAHRTPEEMIKFAKEAAGKGIRVIIAAAGGAAHLPGMIASSTPLPVIGVPVKGSTLDGMDSLLSIVQMPRGVPVATVSINNSINAALLAARILGSSDPEVRKKMEKYMVDMKEEVLKKAERLSEIGYEAYLQK